MKNERKVGCPYSAFTQNSKGIFKYKQDGEEPFKILDDSLKIAEARGTIKEVERGASDPVYTFCTVFYYNEFLSNADRDLKDKLFVNEKETAVDERRSSRAIDWYAEDMEESLGTALKQNGTSLTPLREILKLKDEEEYNEIKINYMIPQCFLDSLRFAYQLEKLFESGSIGDTISDIDYSPVTIMYCKLNRKYAERILHSPLQQINTK